MEDWPYGFAAILVYAVFLVWAWRVKRCEAVAKSTEVKPKAGFWNADLLQFRSFRKVSTILSLFFLIVLLVLAGAILGVVPTIIGATGILTVSKLYDLYEDRRSSEWDYNWQTAMFADGWRQVSENMWELGYWDWTSKEMRTYVLFTDGPILNHLSTAKRGRVRRHVSYLATKKRRRK